MTLWLLRRWTPNLFNLTRSFRSNSALEALAKASEEKTPIIVLYNYPSFSGAFSALFARLFHSHLNLPCLILPFSSVEPLRVEDLCVEGIKTCYFLDFLGPRGFAVELSWRTSCEVIGFDHRKSVLSKISSDHDCSGNLTFHVDIEKSSSTAVYEYFSAKLSEMRYGDGNVKSLLNPKDRDRMELVLKYIEDADLRRWILPNIKDFNIGLGEWRSMLNCITNPHMYEQLLEISSADLIGKGISYISTRQDAAKKLLDKVFKVRLGKGFYGECLGVRADGNSNLSDEIGKELSIKSAAAGLRPIGAVVYMQRNNLKMCLRSTDTATDTSEVAKAYGGGGSPSSSSFIIRMDEYNQWLPSHQPENRTDWLVLGFLDPELNRTNARAELTQPIKVDLIGERSYDADWKGENEGDDASKYESPPWHLNLIVQEDAKYKRGCNCHSKQHVKPPGSHAMNKCEEKMGNLTIKVYPRKTLTMEKKGDMRGLNKKDATAVQSSVSAPSPRPLMPDPICWAVTDLEKIQQTHEMLVSVVKRYPGTRYQEKLQNSAIRKNFALDMRASSFSCKALQI
ncbi:unnamed protein product [Camellia sinensis]